MVRWLCFVASDVVFARQLFIHLQFSYFTVYKWKEGQRSKLVKNLKSATKSPPSFSSLANQSFSVFVVVNPPKQTLFAQIRVIFKQGLCMWCASLLSRCWLQYICKRLRVPAKKRGTTIAPNVSMTRNCQVGQSQELQQLLIHSQFPSVKC